MYYRPSDLCLFASQPLSLQLPRVRSPSLSLSLDPSVLSIKPVQQVPQLSQVSKVAADGCDEVTEHGRVKLFLLLSWDQQGHLPETSRFYSGVSLLLVSRPTRERFSVTLCSILEYCMSLNLKDGWTVFLSLKMGGPRLLVFLGQLLRVEVHPSSSCPRLRNTCCGSYDGNTELGQTKS